MLDPRASPSQLTFTAGHSLVQLSSPALSSDLDEQGLQGDGALGSGLSGAALLSGKTSGELC